MNFSNPSLQSTSSLPSLKSRGLFQSFNLFFFFPKLPTTTQATFNIQQTSAEHSTRNHQLPYRSHVSHSHFATLTRPDAPPTPHYPFDGDQDWTRRIHFDLHTCKTTWVASLPRISWKSWNNPIPVIAKYLVGLARANNEPRISRKKAFSDSLRLEFSNGYFTRIRRDSSAQSVIYSSPPGKRNGKRERERERGEE